LWLRGRLIKITEKSKDPGLDLQLGQLKKLTELHNVMTLY
jgi:hypothetical protein